VFGGLGFSIKIMLCVVVCGCGIICGWGVQDLCVVVLCAVQQISGYVF